MWSEVQRAAGAMERLVELQHAEPAIVAPANPQPLPAMAPGCTQAGQIRFEAVDFRSPSRPEQYALRDFNLTINPGDEESNVQTLTNRHVPTEELLQPIFLDEDEPRDPKSRPVAPVKTPPWFWPLIGLLSFTIILMLAIGLVLFLKSL
jgi:hypothetical protein